jgi:hypothetical protein
MPAPHPGGTQRQVHLGHIKSPPQESQSALGSNWMCEVGGDLSTAIREAMAKSSSEAYLAKAKNGLAKINDFVAGRWATSPWWRLSADAQLPKLDTPCPIVQQ